MISKNWLGLISFFLIINTFLFYTFIRPPAILVLLVILVFVYIRIGRINFLLLTLSFMTITFIFILIAELGFQDKIYYRPSAKLTTHDWDGSGIFKKNEYLEMKQPFGDLRFYANPEKKFQVQPRHIIFKTDSFGFRNNSDYHGQKFIVVGDSYIAGMGNSQKDIISSQLLEKYHIDVYNLGFPGAIPQYMDRIKKFKNKYGDNFQAIVFVFEGNDFSGPEYYQPVTGLEKIKEKITTALKVYKSLFTRNAFTRYTYAIYLNLNRKIDEERVKVFKLKDQKMTFNFNYIKISLRKSYRLPEIASDRIKSVKDNIYKFYFIPTKYRLYQRHLQPSQNEQLPNAQWEALETLCNELNITCENLTEPLMKKSNRLLEKNGELTYWIDDSHWSSKGISVVAKTVCQSIKEPNSCLALPN